MAKLVLGPLLRYVSATEAVLWVETDEPCQVEVLGARAETFSVAGHHYALVVIDGLEPRTEREYEVALDGVRRWPEPDSPFPPSVIRTIDPSGPLRMSFGSCRVSLPHHPPYTLSKEEHPDGREFDALYVLTKEMRTTPRERWPAVLALLGDQVYADEVSLETQAMIRKRRDVREPPGTEVADFTEYAALYRESWSEPAIRWLFSTVSVSMVIDDHDIHDDWRISAAWVEEMERLDWWPQRERAGLAAYWLYQFIGNLSPRLLAESETLARLREADDGWPVLAEAIDRERRRDGGVRWSYCRDLGRTRMIVLESRCGRVLTEGRRSILDEPEWRWLEEQLAGDFDHVLIATSDPFLLAPGLHHVERWGEAVAGGAWGRRWARWAERLRRRFDCDHWAAFGSSYERLSALLERLASGGYGPAPAMVAVLSGDVHHAYLAEASFRRGPTQSAVWQAVCSPFRNALDAKERRVVRAGNGRLGALVARTLARLAGVRTELVRWRISEGPFYDNQVATLELAGRAARLQLQRTTGDPQADDHALHISFERELA